MEDQRKKPLIQVVPSTLSIEPIVNSLVGEADLYESLRSASVLILPTDLSPEFEGPAFPLSTREIFGLLKGGLGNRWRVEAAVRDEEYKEFDYRSDALILPVIFVTSSILIPLVINLVGNYLYDKLKLREGSGVSATVKSEIHFVDPSGAQVTYKYDGPASTYEKLSEDHLREIGNWQEGTGSIDDDNC